ncbi:MAG: peptidylprolyl isomerase [Pseudomonadales bacterium]|nr:peptidylprolyl isomerase [Pseudomonadales bacterium]
MTVPSAEKIQQGSQVELHFSLALTSGDIVDSNFEAKPAVFRIGDGNMLPGFERTLLGRVAGEEFEQILPAADAFGEPNPKNKQRFAIAKFKHLIEDDLIPTEVGSVVAFKDPGGFDLPGVISAIDDQFVSVDFNHPLAGKEIVFKARILSVLEPEQKAIEIKL